jgi:hypothetical protein
VPPNGSRPILLHPRGNDQEPETTMNRPADQDQVRTRLEAAALDLRRGSVVI